MEKVIIIGGGIAGLTCLNALSEAGVEASLFEGGLIGSPKMCGEFITPQAVTLLEKWGLKGILPIDSVEFYGNNYSLHRDLKQPAGAVSRSSAEKFLAERALKLGGKIFETTHINKVIPPSNVQPYFRMQLDKHELKAKVVFFANGKFHSSDTRIQSNYVGIKMHLPRPLAMNNLKMFFLNQAYLGIVPISKDTCNLACLIRKKKDGTKLEVESFMGDAARHHPHIADYFRHIDLKNQFPLAVDAPGFGMRQLPAWKNAYWIGDALASLQPAIGAGFTHAMASAITAVQDYFDNSTERQHRYKSKLRRKLWVGNCMHYLMLNPLLGSNLMRIVKHQTLSSAIESIYFSKL